MSITVVAEWKAEIAAELQEAEQALLEIAAAAEQSVAAAKAQQDRFAGLVECLAGLSVDARLARPLAGRLNAERIAVETADRAALHDRQATTNAAKRVRMLQDALAQIDAAMPPEPSDAQVLQPEAAE